MKVIFLLQLVFLLSSHAAEASKIRRRVTREEAETELERQMQRSLQEEEDAEAADGFFANVWSLITGNGWDWKPFGEIGENWKEDDHDINDMGAFVFEMTFNDSFPVSENFEAAVSSIEMETVSKNGLNGDKWNRYAWSSMLDDQEDLYIGTFNANMDYWNMTKFYISIARAPLGMKRAAIVDGFLRWFHGAPIFDSDGAEILKKNPETGEFDLVFQAPKDFVGFRSMTNYNGDVYAGSTNGPDEPVSMQRYDFSFYGEGIGAKVFTNAGGEFRQLDDQGNLDAYDKSIRKMCVSSYTNRLFIGTETHECAKVLIYDAEQESWKKIQQTGDDCKLAVSECLDLGDGKMLIGTWQSLGSAVYVIDEKQDDAIIKVNTPNLWYHMSCGVMELRVFKDQLYLGLLSFPRGFALLRTPLTTGENILGVQSDDWELITGNGFAKEQRQQLGARVSGNEYPWSSAEVNGMYILGTMTISQRGISLKSAELFGMQPQLWASRDGENWQLVTHKDQPGFLFGYRTMQVTSDQRLYIGSSSNLFQGVKKEDQLTPDPELP